MYVGIEAQGCWWICEPKASTPNRLRAVARCESRTDCEAILQQLTPLIQCQMLNGKGKVEYVTAERADVCLT